MTLVSDLLAQTHELKSDFSRLSVLKQSGKRIGELKRYGQA